MGKKEPNPPPNYPRPPAPPPPPATEAEGGVREGVTLLMGAVADLIYSDPHRWSERGCPTCRAISAIIGLPFGCDRYRAEKAAKRAEGGS